MPVLLRPTTTNHHHTMNDYTQQGSDPGHCEELARKAAMPDSMGGHGQPDGRPMDAPETNDSNHPPGSGNHRPGITTS